MLPTTYVSTRSSTATDPAAERQARGASGTRRHSLSQGRQQAHRRRQIELHVAEVVEKVVDVPPGPR